jgi:cell division protein YceG involved in septum cleavage
MATSYRRTFQGAWELTDSTKQGYLFTRQYFFYTKREATRLFREALKAENEKEKSGAYNG